MFSGNACFVYIVDPFRFVSQVISGKYCGKFFVVSAKLHVVLT